MFLFSIAVNPWANNHKIRRESGDLKSWKHTFELAMLALTATSGFPIKLSFFLTYSPSRAGHLHRLWVLFICRQWA
jgi:hypothetical protein